jgi:5-methylcytosine-specific restriction protein A
MKELARIKPKKPERVYDLVKKAGVDVRSWGKNFKRGPRYAAMNPRYCFDWAFLQPKKVVVVNYWHVDMEQRSGKIIIRTNLKHAGNSRLRKYQSALLTARKNKLPIRVIVLLGKSSETYKKVSKRILDSAIWHVTAYYQKTGECTLTRGEEKYVDQFSMQTESSKKPQKHKVSGLAYNRSLFVRSNVLARAEGKCEWCNKPGFLMENGKIYLETHNVISLSDDGDDSESNVTALCPNHHREAHHGKNRAKMRKEFLNKLSGL